MVMAHGFSRKEVTGILSDYRKSSLIDQPTKAILDYAHKLTLQPNRMTEADIRALREHGLTDEKILEATMVAATFNMMDRLADALGAPVEQLQDNIEKIQKARGSRRIM